VIHRRLAARRAAQSRLSVTPGFNIETFGALIMIVASSGRYLPVSGHDHEAAKF
jgi:hypothetical protein